MLCLVVGEAQLFQPLVEIGQASTVAGHLQATAVASAGRMRATRSKNGMAGFHALQEQCITNTNRSPYWLLCCESIVRSSFVILNLRDLSQFAMVNSHIDPDPMEVERIQAKTLSKH